MNELPLTLALGPYEHTRDVTDGSVPVLGVSLRTLNLPIEEIFYRFTVHREWDISEMSSGKLIAIRSQPDPDIVALPVFISRAFRHSMFYIKRGSPIKRLEDLGGKKVGVPEWAQSAGIYGRGILSDHLGVDLTSIRWVQAGVNEAGRVEKVRLKLPDGLSYTPVPDKCLNDMLLDGSIDAVMSARPPVGLGSSIERLVPDYVAAEERYFRDTHIYPVMHMLALKSSVLLEHPWVAMNLFKAFDTAKNRSLERLRDVTASHVPFAWAGEYAKRMEKLFGADFFPYGIGNDEGGRINRATLAAFCKFSHDQGITDRLLAVEDLFTKNVLSAFRV